MCGNDFDLANFVLSVGVDRERGVGGDVSEMAKLETERKGKKKWDPNRPGSGGVPKRKVLAPFFRGTPLLLTQNKISTNAIMFCNIKFVKSGASRSLQDDPRDFDFPLLFLLFLPFSLLPDSPRPFERRIS